jgi:hypothetical protein
MKFVRACFAVIQRRYLRRIGEALDPPRDLLTADPDTVKETLAYLTKNCRPLLSRLAVRVPGPAFRSLLACGHVMNQVEQIPMAVRLALDKELALSVDKDQYEEAKRNERVGMDHEPSLLEEFVTFLREHPGGVFRDDIRLHKGLLITSMWRNDIVVLPRSKVESVSHEKHLAIRWERRVPLLTIGEDRNERVLRREGTTEYTRFRVNQFPYALSHGLGLGGGGVRDDVPSTSAAHNLAFELGISFPEDPQSKLSNRWACDVEKIVQEASVLNGRCAVGHLDHVLPGEADHTVGQNPAHGSSIAATQHSQVAQANIRKHPIFQLSNRPQWSGTLNACVDIVQVGRSEDSFFIKFVSDLHEPAKLIRFVQELRIAAMRVFGPRNVDFNAKVLPFGNREDSRRELEVMRHVHHGRLFALCFGIIGNLSHVEIPVEGSETGLWVLKNHETGETTKDCCVDTMGAATTGGEMLTFSDARTKMCLENGRRAMSDLYDVARKPGSRAFARRFLLAKLGHLDGIGDVTRDKYGDDPAPDIFSSRFAFSGADHASLIDAQHVGTLNIEERDPKTGKILSIEEIIPRGNRGGKYSAADWLQERRSSSPR